MCLASCLAGLQVSELRMSSRLACSGSTWDCSDLFCCVKFGLHACRWSKPQEAVNPIMLCSSCVIADVSAGGACTAFQKALALTVGCLSMLQDVTGRSRELPHSLSASSSRPQVLVLHGAAHQQSQCHASKFCNMPAGNCAVWVQEQ